MLLNKQIQTVRHQQSASPSSSYKKEEEAVPIALSSFLKEITIGLLKAKRIIEGRAPSLPYIKVAIRYLFKFGSSFGSRINKMQ